MADLKKDTGRFSGSPFPNSKSKLKIKMTDPIWLAKNIKIGG